jgi:SAM-dependent methyltransferase
MSQQDRTLDRYQELMQINAASHVLRAAREVGIFNELRLGQRTADQLAEALQLDRAGLDLMLECLLSMNVVERYGDDHALAPVMQLLCQYDNDLGDIAWQQLARIVRDDQAIPQDASPAIEIGVAPGPVEATTRDYLDSIAATQWVHTPAAMQAAEMLDMGGETGPTGLPEPDGGTAPLRIVDLGCGSAVWSCAMAYRDGQATILAIDDEPPLAAARSTADSIRMGDRFETSAGDPAEVPLEESYYGLAVIAQRLHALTPEERDKWIDRAIASLHPGGRLVLIDLFRGPTKPRLSETIEALRVHVGTGGGERGKMQSADELKTVLRERGLVDIRFSFIAASRVNLGMMVATKAAD